MRQYCLITRPVAVILSTKSLSYTCCSIRASRWRTLIIEDNKSNGTTYINNIRFRTVHYLQMLWNGKWHCATKVYLVHNSTNESPNDNSRGLQKLHSIYKKTLILGKIPVRFFEPLSYITGVTGKYDVQTVIGPLKMLNKWENNRTEGRNWLSNPILLPVIPQRPHRCW